MNACCMDCKKNADALRAADTLETITCIASGATAEEGSSCSSIATTILLR